MSSLAVASAILPAQSLAAAALGGPITFRATETLKQPGPAPHAVSGIGHFTISGAITEKGTVTDYRRQKGNIAVVHPWR